jgi:hypothetical protein
MGAMTVNLTAPNTADPPACLRLSEWHTTGIRKFTNEPRRTRLSPIDLPECDALANGELHLHFHMRRRIARELGTMVVAAR